MKQLHYDIKNVRFLTSGMKRTNETLRILFGDVPYEEDPRFMEVDFGIFPAKAVCRCENGYWKRLQISRKTPASSPTAV